MPKTAAKMSVEEQNRRRRYRKAIALIRKWMSEDPAYDERVGKALDQERFPITMGRERRQPWTS